MAQSIVDALIKVSKSEFTSSVADGIPDQDPDAPYMDTGSFAFNALLCGDIWGGFSPHKITLVAGAPATGKTWYAMAAADAFLKENTGEFDRVFYFESEKAVTQGMFENYGIDTKRVQIFEVDTVEDFRNQAVRIVEEYIKIKTDLEKKGKPVPKLAWVLDSLGQLTTEWELENARKGANKKDMGKRAALLRSTFRPLAIKLGRAKISMLVTNHTYDQMTAFSGKKMGGGDGAVYAGSTIVFLAKIGFKEGKEKAGNIIRVTLQKGRFTIEGKQVDTKLYFGRGLDRYWGLLPIARKWGLVQVKPGSGDVDPHYIFPDPKTGEFKKGKSWINPAEKQSWYCDPERAEEWFTMEFLEKVNAVCKKEFLYGSEQDRREAMEAQDKLEAELDAEVDENAGK